MKTKLSYRARVAEKHPQARSELYDVTTKDPSGRTGRSAQAAAGWGPPRTARRPRAGSSPLQQLSALSHSPRAPSPVGGFPFT